MAQIAQHAAAPSAAQRRAQPVPAPPVLDPERARSACARSARRPPASAARCAHRRGNTAAAPAAPRHRSPAGGATSPRACRGRARSRSRRSARPSPGCVSRCSSARPSRSPRSGSPPSAVIVRGTFSGALIQANIARPVNRRSSSGLAEEHPRRLVPDPDVDAEPAPLALQHLLDQLARAVAGGGHQLERERLASGVVADAVPDLAPAGLVEQRAGRRQVLAVARHVVAVDPVQRADAWCRRPAGGPRTAARSSPARSSPMHQRLAHPQVGQDRVVEIEVDVLVDQPRLVVDRGTGRRGAARTPAPGRG